MIFRGLPALFLALAIPATAQSQESCFTELSRIANIQAAPSPQASDNACIITEPVKLYSTLAVPSVQFPGEPVLDCPFALALVKFIQERAQPLAEFHLGSPLGHIDTGPGFTCRRRYNKPDGKLSEHALGNAIDIAAFGFMDGRNLTVRSSSTMADREAAFFDATRQQSCTYFTTVLGPGSNEAHATHLHFDLGRSKGNSNPYRICE